MRIARRRPLGGDHILADHRSPGQRNPVDHDYLRGLGMAEDLNRKGDVAR
jgi:hypothetical protein